MGIQFVRGRRANAGRAASEAVLGSVARTPERAHLLGPPHPLARAQGQPLQI